MRDPAGRLLGTSLGGRGLRALWNGYHDRRARGISVLVPGHRQRRRTIDDSARLLPVVSIRGDDDEAGNGVRETSATPIPRI